MYVLFALSFFVATAEPQWDQLVTIGCRTDSLKSLLVVTSSILVQLGLVGSEGECLRREIAMEAIQTYHYHIFYFIPTCAPMPHIVPHSVSIAPCD